VSGRAGTQARVDFTRQLVEAGHQIPLGSSGVVGRSAVFEDVVAGLSRALRQRLEADQTVERMSFPAVVPQSIFEKTDYVTSFPQMIGSVRVFNGDNAAHAQILRARQAEEDWTAQLCSSDLMMLSAACHPLYALVSGQLPHPRRFDVIGHCFRHEPSDDPSRMVCFRMHEQVYVGSVQGAVQHRDRWLSETLDLLESLGLRARVDVANDPFFGRAGKLLSTGQRDDALKYEILYDIFDDGPTAIASANAHQSHFGETFGIELPDGTPAHSSCFGLGLERTTLSLFREHGTDPSRWSTSARSILEI